jgi:hypothetical protein
LVAVIVRQGDDEAEFAQWALRGKPGSACNYTAAVWRLRRQTRTRWSHGPALYAGHDSLRSFLVAFIFFDFSSTPRARFSLCP